MNVTVAIPSYVEMLLPTLKALDRFGGSGTRGEVDKKTLDLMQLTHEQLGEDFQPHARKEGSKVVRRLAWARTYLKKLGAIDNSRRGVWTLEWPGRKYLEMDPTEAASALRNAYNEVRRQQRGQPLPAAATATPQDKAADVAAGDSLVRLAAANPEALTGLAQDRVPEADFENLETAGLRPPPQWHQPQAPTARATLSRRALLTAGLAGIGGLVLVASGALRRPAASPRRPPGLPAATSGTQPTVPSTMATPPTLVSAPASRVHDLYPNAVPNAIALTIDDGPDPAWTPTVLDELGANHVSATFSMIGRWTVLYPDLARQVVAAGHAICNHSMTHHIPFTGLSPDRIEAEVAGASTAIVQATGARPTVFRSPAGAWSPAVLASVASHGMRPIEWDVDSRDWQRPGTSSILARLLAAKPGDILLCHDGGGDRSETVAALRTAIPALRSRGLVFVTM